ncbi:MAG: hypothetical protein COV48_16170 [Elusimicrobia bacterium CG11_big_fil_rev_8_21_14_0_20_64_6]|nr:MAG: hypothetical protein COV48_16170 [Elusimicrobia bacterium CG11_big_fil_rev_8_21_14_0_20_64_6]
MELAARLDRLWATIIDHLLIIAVGCAAGVVIPAFLKSKSMPIVIFLLVAALIAIFAAQIWLLTTRGQTIGKRIIGLRIVKTKDMSNGGFVTNVLLRVLACWAISLVPALGTLFALADPFFIFREDRRCLHDHIAGTCVIKA